LIIGATIFLAFVAAKTWLMVVLSLRVFITLAVPCGSMNFPWRLGLFVATGVLPCFLIWRLAGKREKILVSYWLICMGVLSGSTSRCGSGSSALSSLVVESTCICMGISVG
jgi:hypothetical protein